FVYVDNTITAVKPNTNDPKKVKLDVPIGDMAVGSEVVVSWEFTVRNLGRDTMTSANGVNISHKSNVTYDALQNSSEILTFNVAGINLIVIGTVTDIIPKDFALSDKSKADINADVNTKFTENLDGTTTIVRENVRIDIVQKVTDVPFVIKRKDNSYGARFSNDEAWFDFRLADVPDMSKGFFEVPSIFVNPKTTNDEFVNNEINTDYSFDIKVNDAFSSGTKFTDNGYAVSDYSITITDSAGNPKTYTNSVDRFNASLDTTTKKLKFNTANEGAYALYYIVKATATKGTETKQLVSRPTLVTIKTKTTPNTAAVILTKRVTENSAEINSGDSFILKLAKTDNTLKSDVVLISNVGENSKTVMLAPGEYTITEIDAMNYDLVDISGNKGAFNSATKTYTFSVVKGDVVNIVVNNAKTSSDGITAGINNNLAT
ncbi:MAG: hypothetical protein RR088_02690, partial [Clostridia bacterium]